MKNKRTKTISPTELRIGNFVQVFGNTYPVCELRKNYIACCDENGTTQGWENKFINGIPLSEERLQKYGFKDLDGDGMGFSFYSEISGITFEWYKLKPNIITITDCNINGREIEVDFEHQLQNLYFALTNQELILSV